MVADRRFEGRGGQQLLLPREPFCPGKHCLKRCGAQDCTCKPCRMPCCRRRQPRRSNASGTPDLIRAFDPPQYQRPLFTTSTRSNA